MISGLDPTKVDWNNPSVVYLIKYFETATKARDEEIDQLKKQIAQLIEENDQSEKQIAQLIEENDQLKRRIKGGNASKGTTGNKRSYNVRKFKGYPRTAKSSKKTKNRSSHRRPEPKIGVERDADQTQCPQCGCALSDPIEIYNRVSEDLIDFKWTATRWTVTRRYCKNCDKQRTPTLDGVRPKEHFGVAIMAQAATMRCMNISFGKIKYLMAMFYGVDISKATLNHFCDVVGNAFESLYEDLKKGMHGNTAVYGDETGWYVNGDRYWVWVFVGKDQAVFVIDKSRKRKVALSILEEFDGIVVSDSFGAWNHIGGMQQKCLLHYFRDMYRTKEKNTGPEFSRFFSTLYHILKDAIGRKKGHNNRNSKKECIKRIKKLKARVRRLVDKKYDCKDCKRYVKRLKREIDSLFTFILYDVQYHNNISERMLRAFAEARKVLYGSRTKKGADRTAIMMSVHATCNMRGINFYDFAQECLAGKTTVIPEKSAVQTVVCASTA